MSEAGDPVAGVIPAAEGVGQALRRLRVGRGLSTQDIGNQLKIPARKVEALEDEQWSLLPELPYLRGLLRGYARVLDTDPSALLALLDQSHPVKRLVMAEGPKHLKAPFPQHGSGQKTGQAKILGLATIAIALAAGIVAWTGTSSFHQLQQQALGAWTRFAPADASRKPESTSHAVATTPSMTEVPTVAPLTAAPAASASGPDAAALATGTPSVAPLSAAPVNPTGTTSMQPIGGGANGQAATPVGTAPANPSSASAAPMPSLSAASELSSASSGDGAEALIELTDDAWIEVRDSSGKVLTSKLYKAGDHGVFAGRRPLSATIGNADAVTLTDRGHAVDLSSSTRDHVARVTLP